MIELCVAHPIWCALFFESVIVWRFTVLVCLGWLQLYFGGRATFWFGWMVGFGVLCVGPALGFVVMLAFWFVRDSELVL